MINNAEQHNQYSISCYFQALPVLIVTMCFFLPLTSVLILALLSPFMGKLSNKFFLYYVFAFIVVFFATLKPFGDLAEYLAIYHEINDGLNIFTYTRFGNGLEVMYLIFMQLIGELSHYNEIILLSATYALISYLLLRLTRGLDYRFRTLCLCMLFVNLNFIEVTSYFIRQVLSVLTFLCALKESRGKKYILFLISILFHVSAVVNVAVYIFTVLVTRTKSAIFRVFIPCVVLALILLIVFKILPLPPYVTGKLSELITNEKFTTLPLNYIIVTSVNMLIIFLSFKFVSVKSLFYKVFLLKEIFVFFLLLPFPALSNRFGMVIYAFPMYFLLPLFFRSNVSFLHKYYFGIAVFVLNLIPFLYLMYNVSNGGNQYTFLENRPFTYGIYDVLVYIADSYKSGLHYINEGN